MALQETVVNSGQLLAATSLTLGEYVYADEILKLGRFRFPNPNRSRQRQRILVGDVNDLDISKSGLFQEHRIAWPCLDVGRSGLHGKFDLPRGEPGCGGNDEEHQRSPRFEDSSAGSQHGELVGQSTQHI